MSVALTGTPSCCLACAMSQSVWVPAQLSALPQPIRSRLTARVGSNGASQERSRLSSLLGNVKKRCCIRDRHLFAVHPVAEDLARVRGALRSEIHNSTTYPPVRVEAEGEGEVRRESREPVQVLQ